MTAISSSSMMYFHPGAYYGSTYRIDITEYTKGVGDMRFTATAVRLASPGRDEYDIHGRIYGASAADCAATLGLWCGVDAAHNQSWHEHQREDAAKAARRKQREEAAARKARSELDRART